MAATRTGYVWIDAQGERVLHVSTTASGAGSILSQLKALSNADFSFSWEAVEHVFTPSPVAATYPTVRVSAQLNYSDATGSLAKLYIPAPVTGIFLSDGVTIDPTAITALNAAVIGQLLAGSGAPVTAFLGGQLWQQKISGIASLQVFTP